ncbi:DUF927 domain-containing protein [Chelatococcus asaccharovorans]|uniref:DUF927 domain-containing protein n=1 Tax=Chelatococcus asaccharovorans TaxID=28210 RepID=UPI0014757462|nr:DUF927 domain-containing protein [Chelatococcus asaccharovorans]MBS7705451.1 DUF927 domain-containing protein [Chelatococcus asaccharovorans]
MHSHQSALHAGHRDQASSLLRLHSFRDQRCGNPATLALLAAASVAGSAKRTQAPTLDVTARGLEELGNAYNDVLLPLDEAPA